MKMVTYSDLFQLGILIVNIIALIIQVNNKKK
ncbi:putative holin-like toxin [Colidextribacter sp. 210702-DFI.3.9]|nr:putative holin-like toxin [Colidextribacter sp. 210702-DFI.3.9]MCG4469326.1 putative holin-like toxin [Lawsonibacter sp. DFI.6.74]MCG4772709.1 putative holin-like toxin [Lawsonibacter sp. DFI.5.51]